MSRTQTKCIVVSASETLTDLWCLGLLLFYFIGMIPYSAGRLFVFGAPSLDLNLVPQFLVGREKSQKERSFGGCSLPTRNTESESISAARLVAYLLLYVAVYLLCFATWGNPLRAAITN